MSISIITALSVAVLENPQIQVWIEEQRKKIQELLRSIGEELDPQSRRAAEAFAFEGRTAANDAGIRREAAASTQAAAIATGRSLESGNKIYRIPVKGPMDPNDAEERRRKGREYLAKRNREMQMRRSKVATKEKEEEAPQSPTFDSFVDNDGKLKASVLGLPVPPTSEPVCADVAAEMRQVERNLAQPILATGEPSSSAWERYTNPFGDEYALERSVTPKQPPVPPKIALEPTEAIPDPEISVPGSWTPTEARSERQQTDPTLLSYEEQLAIAMSLSEQESSTSPSGARHQGQPEHEEAEMAAAIAASLRDMHVDEATNDVRPSETLVDLTPSTPVVTPRRGGWEAHLESLLPAQDQQVRSPSHASSDDLYGATPELTKARLANSSSLHSGSSHLPFDPVRDAARTSRTQQSSSSYASATVSPTSARGRERDAQTPTSHTPSSFGFQEDDSDDFQSVGSTSTASRAQSQVRSEVSDIEVVDLLDDSDVDLLSGEDDGVLTPDSWSEVGSRDADSDLGDEEAQRPATMRS